MNKILNTAGTTLLLDDQELHVMIAKSLSISLIRQTQEKVKEFLQLDFGAETKLFWSCVRYFSVHLRYLSSEDCLKIRKKFTVDMRTVPQVQHLVNELNKRIPKEEREQAVDPFWMKRAKKRAYLN